MTYHRRTTCRLCDSTQLALALHYPPQPLADEYLKFPHWQASYPLDLYLCEECGCAQLLDVVSGDEIYPAYTYETGSSPALVEHFRRYAWDISKRLMLRSTDLIVDIGGNDGTLLSYFPDLHRINVDPAPVSSDTKHTARLYSFFASETTEFIQSKFGQARVITANNVYANIDDLRGFTDAVRNLLAGDGVFVFETFYLADLIDNMVFDFIYHEHLTAFSVAPLVGFFQRLGMQIFDVQRVPTKGGSIRVYVQLEGGMRKVQPIVAQMVDMEFERGLGKLPAFVRMRRQMAEKCNQLRYGLDTVHALGRTIAGYGASPTSTTLIYTAGIGKYLNYLIDDWPGKQGTFSPGLHLPVYSWGDLSTTDYCVILAWRYADAIMARNPQYRGTWIVPLPELKVIPPRRGPRLAASRK